jgi:hypothetical protein
MSSDDHDVRDDLNELELAMTAIGRKLSFLCGKPDETYSPENSKNA